jgi:PAS domain-containing protein
VSLYCPDSRQAMEQLRAHAIKHRRGFTVDAEIRRPDGEHRWMRLSAMPVLDGGLVMRLRGTKIDVTDEYDAPRLQDDEAQH